MKKVTKYGNSNNEYRITNANAKNILVTNEDERGMEKFKTKALKDEGFALINKLVNAEKTIFYGTEGEVGARDRKTLKVVDIPFPLHSPGYQTTGTKNEFALNFSETDYSKLNPYYLPKKGYQGQVMIAHGHPLTWQRVYNEGEGLGYHYELLPVSRYGIIYHELNENYIRTVMHKYYEEAHSLAGGLGDPNAFIFEK